MTQWPRNQVGPCPSSIACYCWIGTGTLDGYIWALAIYSYKFPTLCVQPYLKRKTENSHLTLLQLGLEHMTWILWVGLGFGNKRHEEMTSGDRASFSFRQGDIGTSNIHSSQVSEWESGCPRRAVMVWSYTVPGFAERLIVWPCWGTWYYLVSIKIFLLCVNNEGILVFAGKNSDQ